MIDIQYTSNIITNSIPDQVNEEVFSKFATTSYGSRNTREVNGGLDFTRERINLSFNGQLFNSDGLDQPFSRFLNDTVNTSETTKEKLPVTQRYVNLSLSLKNKSEELQTTMDLVSSNEERGIFESTVASSNDFCNCPLPQANPNAEGSINRTTSTYGAIQLNYNPTRTNINYTTRLNLYSFNTAIDYNAGGNRFGLSSFSSRALEGEISVSPI